MATVTLGSTGITVERNGFGALPIQRISQEEAVHLLRRAYHGGMTFFDTSRAYSDSEEKLGIAFGRLGIREKLTIATKTMARTPEDFWKDLHTSLTLLQTDYLDIYQFHIPPVCYLPGDGTGMYECMLEAKAQGKIRHIGLTNHSLKVAHACVDSGAYETLQFPLSYLASDKELELVEKCRQANMGYIAMKGLAGGLIHSSAAAYGYMMQFQHVVPIWGIQRESELEEFLSYVANPPVMNDDLRSIIAGDRAELVGDFCRGCGYCMPCTAEIEINNCARMSLMIRRAPAANWLTPDWQEKMNRIPSCTDCGKCKEKCPYQLDTPELLKKNYEDYQKILAGNVSVN